MENRGRSRKRVRKHRRKLLPALMGFFVILFCVSLFQVIRIGGRLSEEEEMFAALSERVSEEGELKTPPEETKKDTDASYASLSEQSLSENSFSDSPASDRPLSNRTGGESSVLPQYAALFEENSDLAGWIKIDGTRIDYPVMFTPKEPEYYLKRAFDKSSSMSGVPFIGEGSSVDSANIIIYGHKMKNGTMFSDLLHYSEEGFWRKHRIIHFDTLFEEKDYEVLGAFYSRAYYQNEVGVFRYYTYTDLTSPDRFEEYYRQVKAASLYDTGVSAKYGDRLLTLSTCSYHVKDGRFVVVAKEIQH